MAEDEQDITEEEARAERIVAEKYKVLMFLNQAETSIKNMELIEGVDKNSWIYAGCIQDLQKAKTRILAYIERCLK